jgi:hypothetical protein
MQAKCQSLLNYGESEDPAKMTYSRLDLIERGLGAVTTSATITLSGQEHGSMRHVHERASARAMAY